MQIREATQEELPFIRKQRVEAYSDHAASLPDEHWQALKKAISSEADQQPGVELYVAELDGNIVGSVALFPAKTDAYEGYVDAVAYPELRVLAVSSEARGKGVGQALVQTCIDRAKAQGYDAIGLHTGEFMEQAMALYEKHGFKRQPEHDFEPANDGIIVKAFKKEL
ncbi:GNAT family N-acetyltransferase [Halobacillus litoralis]|uniref:GNAT family N-acetyltransferase n=1 Tax=Halobacillus litoralis TaxID=45668 RepID=UPI001CD8127F|nr:GNAT family N-acetyltransferase [Halobacillus litoralis]